MIDEKKLLEWLEREKAICENVAKNHSNEADRLEFKHWSVAYNTVIWRIKSEIRKLNDAHARIDHSRKSNAKPVEEDFVFPLTVEGNAEWDAQKKMHEAANEITESRVKVKMFPDRSCLPCRSDETNG